MGSSIQWSPDDSLLLLGLANGEVNVYDNNGNFQSRLTVLCGDETGMNATTASSDNNGNIDVDVDVDGGRVCGRQLRRI